MKTLRNIINDKKSTPQTKEAAMFASRQEEIKKIKQIQKDINAGKVGSPSEHEDYRKPEDITLEKTVLISLSWGGPADGFKLFYHNNKLNGGVYYFGDWGIYEEAELNNEEAKIIEDYYLHGNLSRVLAGPAN